MEVMPILSFLSKCPSACDNLLGQTSNCVVVQRGRYCLSMQLQAQPMLLYRLQVLSQAQTLPQGAKVVVMSQGVTVHKMLGMRTRQSLQQSSLAHQ